MAVVPLDDVLRRAESGDLAALEALFRAHETALYTLARRLCRTDADAEDALQDTFVEASRSLSRFRGEGSIAGWLKRICATKALMRLRRQGLEADAPPEPSARTDGAAGPPERLDLAAALERLSDTARVVVWLHDVEGHTHDEIAAALGKTASFSKSQLARAHVRLRLYLDGAPPDGGTP